MRIKNGELKWGVGGILAFLLLQSTLVGLIPAHVVMVVLFAVLYFAHPVTRRLAVAMLPFVAFEICYDWMRLWPNYKVNPIDIRGLYEAELALFGITADGTTMIPGQYFTLHTHPVADLLAGAFYLCWVPLPIAFGLWLYFTGRRRDYLRFSLAFLLVNLIGFAGYYIHPAAPPWYALNYGFEPLFDTPGNVAGLARFDHLTGVPVFHSIYAENANVFAAVPSLHAAYMLIATVYAVITRQKKATIAVFAVVTAGIWWTAVYSCHHYIIDVLLGILTAFVGIVLFEKVLMRTRPFLRFFDSYRRYITGLLLLFLLFPLCCGIAAANQSGPATLTAEAQVTASTGDHTPLWLNANKYGLSSLETTNGYLRATLEHPVLPDSLRRWSWGYGADVAVAAGFTSTLVVQQAYGELRWLKGRLVVGSRQHPLQLKNQQLSTGSQTLGVNARPVPSIRIELPDYWDVVYTRRWLGIKGHIAYGIQTDDRWQRHFTAKEHRSTRNAKLHTKAGYLRMGREGSWLTVEGGLEMGCQYGGTSYMESPRGLYRVENQDGLKGMWQAFIPSGGEAGEGIYKNKGGNHVGSWLLRINVNQPAWQASVYADHFFEDHSQMFFLDYDGYGEGDRYNEWVDRRWLVYSLKDIMLGAEVRLRHCRWVDAIVAEYIYTKYQSGPIYHDRTRLLSDHIGGRDNYYNHHFHTGWQHWGQVMGNPLYRSPLYNDDGTIRVHNNRFWAWHAAVSGKPAKRLSYRLMATWQRGWGTYDEPLTDPSDNVSLLAEAEYRLPSATKGGGEWTFRAAWALDHGALLSLPADGQLQSRSNMGVQLTVAKNITLGKPKKP